MAGRGSSQWLAGVIIIGLGILLLLNNFGVTDISIWNLISDYWPIFLIIWGTQFLTYDGKGVSEIVTGVVLTLVGILLLGNNLDWFSFNISYLWKVFWPVILILLGINFIRGMKPIGKSNWALMGGFEKKHEQWQLEDGDYWAVMGGIELDLRSAIIEDREYSIACNAIMGGIELVVPKDVTVICEGTAILGGVELLNESAGGIVSSLKSEQIANTANNKVIKIYCRAFLGGIEVKARER